MCALDGGPTGVGGVYGGVLTGVGGFAANSAALACISAMKFGTWGEEAAA